MNETMYKISRTKMICKHVDMYSLSVIGYSIYFKIRRTWYTTRVFTTVTDALNHDGEWVYTVTREYAKELDRLTK